MDIRKTIGNAMFPKNPLKELKQAFKRERNAEYSNFASIKGRGVCLLHVPYHAVGIVAKPIIIGLGAALIGLGTGLVFFGVDNEEEVEVAKGVILSARLATAAVVSPIGQIAQLVKAILGIITPTTYFRPPKIELAPASHDPFAHVAPQAQRIYRPYQTPTYNLI